MLFPPAHSSASPSRVVITGAGIVTSLGLGWKQNADGFRLGRIAIKPVTLFDVSRQRVKVAGEVDLPASASVTRLRPRHEKRLDRATRLLLLAAHEAWQQSGWQPSDRLPIVLGTTSGGMGLGEAYYRQAIHTPQIQRRQPSRVMQYQAQCQAMTLAETFEIATAPSTSSPTPAPPGPTPSAMPGNFCGAAIATASSPAVSMPSARWFFPASIPFRPSPRLNAAPSTPTATASRSVKARVFLTLETLQHAQKRGAKILGEIVGYGASLDTHHLTQPHPQGDAALASMNAATKIAGLTPSRIDYINAHGTVTPMNDGAEANAIHRWAAERGATLPVSSTKSSVGHLLGAAGAVEAIICLMALREQWLPPTSTLQTPDAACTFPVVRTPTSAKLEYALTNSFGFGGANASLILRRWS